MVLMVKRKLTRWRYVWVARKPENAATADYDYHDQEKEEATLEEDDPVEVAIPEEQVAATAHVNSPAILVQPTSELTLNPPNASEEEPLISTSPTVPSESRKSMPSMQDILNQPDSASTTPPESHSPTTTVAEIAIPSPLQSNVTSEEDPDDRSSTRGGAEEAPPTSEDTEPRVKIGTAAFSGNFLGGA
jgi:hypothetical protein